MNDLKMVKVEPQPDYINTSGRWVWDCPGFCHVATGSREWWEYAPSEMKPHPLAEGVILQDGLWYWAFPCRNKTTPRRKWYVVPDYQPNGTPATTAHVVDAAGQEVATFERIADAEAAVTAVNGRDDANHR